MMKTFAFVLLIFWFFVFAPIFSDQDKSKGIKNELTGFNSPGNPFDFQSQWALIIGINQYSYYNNLEYAVVEAKKVKKLLITRYGYNPNKVKHLVDNKASKDAIMLQLKAFVVDLREKDNLFVYFSGHGYVDHILKTSYWLPADVGKDKQDVRNKSDRVSRSNIKISSHEIKDILRECKAKHIFVVADSCFSGKLFASESKKGRLPGYYKRKSRQLFASGRELVGDGVFGDYFIDFLKTNEAPYILASDLISEVKRNVINNTDLEPEGRAVKHTDDRNGEFILVRRLASLKQIEYKPNLPTDPTDIDVSELKTGAEKKRLRRQKEKAYRQSWQWNFQKEVENQQKINEDKTISFTSRRKSWENISSKYNKDNPDTGEDEELREFVNGRIKYWKAKEKEEIQWSNWQRKFEQNVEKIKKIETDPDISSTSKKEKWQELLNAYIKDNPYSREDEKLRNYVKKRILSLERNIRDKKVPGFDDKVPGHEDRNPPSSKIPGFKKKRVAFRENKKDNPFGKEINNKAKRIYKNSKGFWEADYGDGIVMVYIPAGEFKMGSDDGYPEEKPPHIVYLDEYWIGKYEVTFDQYDKYCEETQKKKPDDEGWGRVNRPVINVSWDDAIAYCDWLSKKTGLKFNLPTEAQWEKAARGTDGRQYPWGNHHPYYKGQYYANYDPDKRFRSCGAGWPLEQHRLASALCQSRPRRALQSLRQFGLPPLPG